MKKKKTSIKKTIHKKIDLKQAQHKRYNSNVKKMGSAERSAMRTGKAPRKPAIPVDLVGRNQMRMRQVVPPKVYQKKINVDYDVIICIPSHERYEKVKRLISQFYEQDSKYSFKIVLLNDGSKDQSYDSLPEHFPDITYLKNETPNGKINHWYCYNQLWDHLRNLECHTILQMDDDFVLCDKFLNTIIDIYFQQKEIDDHMRGVAPHLWSFNINNGKKYQTFWNDKRFVDGICLLDPEIVEGMKYGMKPVDLIVNEPGVPVRAWDQISTNVKNINGYFHRTSESLVYHDGNDDSKLHGTVRGNGKGIFTQRMVESLKKYNND